MSEFISKLCIVHGYNFDINSVKSQVENRFDSIRDELYVYLEYPYVDRVFRDSYYFYFSTKHKDYFRDCIRLSFFNKNIRLNHFRDNKYIKKLQDSFIGFMVIRPTAPNIVGRSMLSPKAFKNSNFLTCLTKADCMINGVKFETKAFPHSSQDCESITCAETTIWSCMEYFGTRYVEYMPALPSKIIRILNNLSYQRLLPSTGLTINQISYALKELGFGSRLYSREAFNENEFKKILFYYIESGIPVIASLENEKIGHAVVLTGHEEIDFDKITLDKPDYKLTSSSINIFDSAAFSKKIVAIDDNLSPYRLIDFYNPTCNYDDINFKNCKITSFIVPLYKKIYLESSMAKDFVYSILNNEIIGLGRSKFTDNNIIMRLFLTSSRSFKSKISLNRSMDIALRDTILYSAMPKFIWVAELGSLELYKDKKAFGLIIIDATSADTTSVGSIILIRYPDRQILFDNEIPKLYTTELINSFDIYENNLKGG